MKVVMYDGDGTVPPMEAPGKCTSVTESSSLLVASELTLPRAAGNLGLCTCTCSSPPLLVRCLSALPRPLVSVLSFESSITPLCSSAPSSQPTSQARYYSTSICPYKITACRSRVMSFLPAVTARAWPAALLSVSMLHSW